MNNYEEVERNHFASVVFLDVADDDYISARLLYQNRLFRQSLVMMQQAIEKYLKAILLYNALPQAGMKQGRVRASHDTKKLLNRCQGILIDESTRKFINKLEGAEGIRYRTQSYSFDSSEKILESFDHAVLDIRRYCEHESLKAARLKTDVDRVLFTEGRQLFYNQLEKIIQQEMPDDDATILRMATWRQREILMHDNINFNHNIRPDRHTRYESSPFNATSDPQAVYEAVRKLVFLEDSIHREYAESSVVVKDGFFKEVKARIIHFLHEIKGRF